MTAPNNSRQTEVLSQVGPRFPPLQGPGAATDFERALILKRTQAGRTRYKRDYENGRVGKSVYNRFGRNLPPHRPPRIFDRDAVLQLRRQGLSYRQIAKKLALGLGTVTRTLRERSKSA